MPEREPQTSEQVDLRERGGLTIPHWQEVVKRIGNPRHETETKIVAYAQKVISGEFPDSDFHHRGYLGQRHWYEIESRNGYIIKTPRRFPPWSKTTFVKDELPSEIRQFARSEQHNAYTLNDYCAELGTRTIIDGEAERFFWSLKKERWQIRVKRSKTYAGEYFPLEWEEDSDDISRKGLLFMWLLTKEEVVCPEDKSPVELTMELIKHAKSNPEEIRNRLKNATPQLLHLHASPIFGILEEEIR